MLNELESPDILLALIAILVLLIIWQYYKMQVMAGRILAVDIFDRSSVRLYVYATCSGEHTCPNCSSSHGRVFLPSVITKRGFSPCETPCTNASPCTGILVGLYGGWLEARQVVEQLRHNVKKGWFTLSSPEFRSLLDGAWERSVSAETDRVSMYMLIAMVYENLKQDISIGNYGYVIKHAKEVRDFGLVVPAYIRITQLLVKAQRWGDALSFIEQFQSQYPAIQSGQHFPSIKQREFMRITKIEVLKNQLMKLSA